MLQIHRDHPLDRLTTFGLKSIAEAYAEAHDAEELREAFAAAKREGWRVHVIGGGSNTIAMPRVRGLVLRAAMTGCRIEPLSEGGARVEAGAGELLDRVVRLSVSSGFGTAQLEQIFHTVVSNTGIIPDIVKRDDREDTKVLVFLPVRLTSPRASRS